jgi:hypothetical protein
MNANYISTSNAETMYDATQIPGNKLPCEIAHVPKTMYGSEEAIRHRSTTRLKPYLRPIAYVYICSDTCS